MWRKHGVVSMVAGMVLAGMLWSSPWTGQAGTDVAAIASPEQVPAAATYSADVRVDMNERIVTGMLTARFVPRDDKAYFHLYPNAFAKQADLGTTNWEQVLGKQREPGGITITAVKVDGRRTDIHYEGKTNTLLRVPLPAKQTPAETVVELGFRLQVPYNNGRLSYHDHALWLGNWLPILAVKDSGGWRLDPYTAIGDPFYSEAANYHVRVHLPEGYQLATTGMESVAVITQTRPQRQSIYELDAWNVRDFAMVVMDGTYQAVSGKVGETIVRTWSQQGDDPAAVKSVHETAMGSLDYYGKQFGAYPYKEYDVVKTGGFFGGMEYPGLVFIEEGFFQTADSMGAAVVAHETAHQWFYGIVGNDEVREAWLDESLTDYATMAYLQEKDPKRSQAYIRLRQGQSRAAEAYAKRGISAETSVAAFPDWKSYNELVYGRSGVMWWTLREAWGGERLHRLLRQYVSEHPYELASGEQLKELVSAAAGADATPFFDYWLRVRLDSKSAAEEWVEKGKHE
ncbi:M1 family metallopeptidase [Brevibacillus sp. SAFN-007a]|uniref:M1 family metallopeptidase n=1 Tax=Brevibacillus sp. SAFN-007a TaxID=3436862 RepID=UPI003F80526B